MSKEMKSKAVFICQECGYESPKWLGRCPSCERWNSFLETAQTTKSGHLDSPRERLKPTPLSEIDTRAEPRRMTYIRELDRVLGGGLVKGSIILVGGDPGIGKSTLLIQVLHALAKEGLKVFYVSGEESLHQIKMRGSRLGLDSSDLFILPETLYTSIETEINTMKPEVVVIDSIQTIHHPGLESPAGSLSQIREVTQCFINTAKSTDTTIILIGHVTKEGSLAGPKTLEHMVDTVLYFEGDTGTPYRILRSAKNRFGSVSEVGIFEMGGEGLKEVSNPSCLFTSQRDRAIPGAAVSVSFSGTRPILVEFQALVNPSNYGVPQRIAMGIDRNRLNLLLAVMEKKVGIPLYNKDVFLKITGGLRIDEPAADLGILSAILSSHKEIPIPIKTAVFGEIGVTGEVRTVNQVGARLNEAEKMGFERCIIPRGIPKDVPLPKRLGLGDIDDISELKDVLFEE